ncbi:MAG: 23S rRNA (guanosine(2251)-2'-O)-methyltransferase RlmB [Desulfobacterales bacterium]|nr:23S rRNA (guanosine(2251)-2'-O)-methyltransferase RlmB [Desulfobacterales bacterium]
MDKKARRAEPEKESGYELLWGVHPVLEMLRDNPQRVSEITIHRSRSGPRIQEIIDLARGAGIKLRFDTPRGKGPAGDIDGKGRQGVIARVLPFALLSLDGLIERLRSVDGTPLLLALDTIQDPHNLGAIIRTALAAGAHGVIITRERSAPLSGTVAKASAGAVARMDICRVTNLVTTLKRLQKEGIWVFGTVKDGPLTIHQAEFTRPLCLVVGGEGKGIRPLVREQCDYLVTIPMQGRLDSLNSSVAAAVSLYEIVRQRMTEDG